LCFAIEALELTRAAIVTDMHLKSALSRIGCPVRHLSACAIGFFILCAAAQSVDPEHLFQEAVAAQQRGDDVVAVRDYRELLRIHPSAVVARVNLGVTLADLKRFDEAIAEYRIVLASDPKNRMARSNLALAYKENGDLPSAIKELEWLRRDDPKDEQPVMLLADCLAESGRYGEAISLLAPLEKTQPGNPDLEWLLGSTMIHGGRAAEGVELVEQAAEKSTDASAYLLAGQTRFRMAQFDLAQRDADSAKRVDPNLGGLQTLNGMILERTSDYDGAEAALRQAIAANDTDFDAHLYLGAVFYFKRDLENARVQLQRALQLQTTSAQARYELALVARADGRLDAARQDLETVVRESPEWMQPHVELSALYYRLNRPEDGAKQRQIVDRMIAAQHESQNPAKH
jgi:tetratricopeptide (TPR) repeat protein